MAKVSGLKPVQTAPLLRVSLNKRSEPSSSVMFTDRMYKTIKKLVLAKSIQESSNKLPNLQNCKLKFVKVPEWPPNQQCTMARECLSCVHKYHVHIGTSNLNIGTALSERSYNKIKSVFK